MSGYCLPPPTGFNVGSYGSLRQVTAKFVGMPEVPTKGYGVPLAPFSLDAAGCLRKLLGPNKALMDQFAVVEQKAAFFAIGGTDKEDIAKMYAKAPTFKIEWDKLLAEYKDKAGLEGQEILCVNQLLAFVSIDPEHYTDSVYASALAVVPGYKATLDADAAAKKAEADLKVLQGEVARLGGEVTWHNRNVIPGLKAGWEAANAKAMKLGAEAIKLGKDKRRAVGGVALGGGALSLSILVGAFLVARRPGRRKEEEVPPVILAVGGEKELFKFDVNDIVWALGEKFPLLKEDRFKEVVRVWALEALTRFLKACATSSKAADALEIDVSELKVICQVTGPGRRIRGGVLGAIVGFYSDKQEQVPVEIANLEAAPFIFGELIELIDAERKKQKAPPAAA